MRRPPMFALLGLVALLLPVGPQVTAGAPAPSRLPWREAGLTERAAAAYLLDRLAYGARPGEVDRVVAIGLEAWVEQQLAADLPEATLAAGLARYDVLALPARQLAETFPSPGRLLARARAAGVIEGDPRRVAEGDGRAAGRPTAGSETEAAEAADAADEGLGASDAQREQRRRVMEWARAQGYRSPRELAGQLLGQKLDRAVLAENQLAERLTDFWFNHLTVSTTDPEARSWILAYERDVIRPRVLGRFRDLLGASAKHPAMLVYLDNFRSSAAAGQPTTVDRDGPRRGGLRPGGFPGRGGPGGGGFAGGGRTGGGYPVGGGPDGGAVGGGRSRGPGDAGRPGGPGRTPGLNENYARELLELHTLGVDGGYTQQDVVEVARAFTGWTVVPLERPGGGRDGRRGGGRGREDLFGRILGERGFVVAGDFLFRADAHDAAAKRVLGRSLAAGRGIEDGEEVLDLLAAHPATARHLAGKLAVRFVSDEPPAALVDRLAAAFTATGGDLRATMRALVESPEFWSPAARGAKIKSPLETVASALRATGARVDDPRGAVEWIARMGQPLYAAPAPTGFGDRAASWVSSGSLVARMNFGLELGTGRLAGARVDLAALAGGKEPSSPEEALAAFGPLLLPERDLAAMTAQLAPLAADPQLALRLAERQSESESTESAVDAELAALFGFATGPDRARRDRGWLEAPAPEAAAGPPTPAGSVAGLLLGSPEFQRR